MIIKKLRNKIFNPIFFNHKSQKMDCKKKRNRSTI